jgi:hypothetical protein
MNKRVYNLKSTVGGINISVDSLITAINESTMEDLDTLFEMLPEARIKANIEAAKIIKGIFK